MKHLFWLICALLSTIGSSQEHHTLKVDTTWTDSVEKMELSSVEKSYYNYETDIKSLYNNDTYAITYKYSDTLLFYIEKYKGYKWFPKVVGLADFYFPLIEYKLAEYNIPNELKFLPIVESNMNPRAISHVGASGLWQFMPETGYQYGLFKNNQVNLFYDPVASTEAACKYLSYLNGLFNDWNLALAAYNAGPGTVQKALRRSGGKTFNDIVGYLPKETRAYVPSFHAIKFLYNHRYLSSNKVYQTAFDYSSVVVDYPSRDVSFIAVSKSKNISLELLYYLNPHLTGETIPKDSFVYTIENFN